MAKRFDSKSRKEELDRSRPDDGGGTIWTLLFNGTTINGTAASDYILPLNSTAGTLNGNGGEDLILGDIGGFVIIGNGNTSFATAIDLDSSGVWFAQENPLFADASVPHMTAHISGEAGTEEYFRIVVGAGQTLTIDIDAADGTLGSGADTSTFIRIYAPSDLVNAVAGDSGGVSTEGGYGSQGNDSFLVFTNTGSSSTFFIRIGEITDFNNNFNFEDGDDFLLNVSLTGHAVNAGTAQNNDTIDGGDGDDHLFGAGGNDVLIGGAGDDLMAGGTGDDTYFVDAGYTPFEPDGGDIVAEADGEGDDAVFTNVTYILAANASVETLRVFSSTSTTPLTLIGSSIGNEISGNNGGNLLRGGGGNDSLFGLGGDDQLDGGTGIDTMTGGEGDDFYFIDDAADVIVENFIEGLDTLVAYVSYVLAADVDLEVLDGRDAQGAINLTGNEYVNTLLGNNQANILDGGGSADSLVGGGGDDEYHVNQAGDDVIEFANQGRDVVYAKSSWALGAGQHVEVISTASTAGTQAIDLTGNAFAQELLGNAGVNILRGEGGNDTLEGFGGNDTLIGGTGADAMTGGSGDDTYNIDDAGDSPIEAAGGGSDAIYSSIGYTLGAGREIEVLSTTGQGGTAAFTFVGNEFNQTLYGNAGSNYLDGGAGTDTLVGFGGDDSYVVDGVDDYVAEFGGGGIDTVYVRGSFSLGSGQEVETLAAFSQAGTAPIVIVGNNIAQRLFGNAGNNYLDGGGAADLLVGLQGNDTYVVDNAGDYVAEAAGEGNDIVYAITSFTLTAGQEIETLSTFSQAGTSAINLTGNAFANTIYANNGANILNGGGGNDVLQGFGGADSFQFTTALGAGNVDTLVDFLSGTDKLALDDAIFSGIGGPGSFNANAFVTGAAATNAAHRIVYNQATGQLFYDADGNGAGAAVLFATLSGNPALTASDFQVI